MLGQEKTRELLEQELERLRNENHRLKEELTSLKEKETNCRICSQCLIMKGQV